MRETKNLRNSPPRGGRRAAEKTRLPAILSEAWRDTLSGASHACLNALCLAAIICALIAADISSIRAIGRQLDDYVTSGASTYVVDYSGRIDGAACERIASVNGVQAAGALGRASLFGTYPAGQATDAVAGGRQSDGVMTLAALPSLEIPLYHATGGALSILASNGQTTTTPLPADAYQGIWLSQGLADSIGASAGDTLPLAGGGSLRAAGTYPWPDDGRRLTLSYAAVQPDKHADGRYDYCLVRAWPVPDGLTTLMLTATTAGTTTGTAGDQPTVWQLNGSKGEGIDPAALYATRITRLAPLCALIAGAALGLAAMRVRRLELASTLHCGMGRIALLAQMLMETITWTLAGAVISAPLVAWGALGALGATIAPDLQVMLALARIPLAALAGAATGTGVGVAMTRERHMFAYFKNR